MNKISIVFASVLALSAFSGCKKKGGDCSGTINGVMDRMMAEHKGDMDKAPADKKKMMEDMMKSMTDTMVKTCTDDKWSPEVLKCMDDAKDKSSLKACESQLTPDQQAHMKAMEHADRDDAKAMAGSAAMAADGSAAPSMAGSAAMAAPAAAGDLPAECNDYKAAIDKLSSCDKMPKEARDAMKSAFDQASTSWAGLPAEAKASLATACKAGADAVKQSASMCN